jgi:hypothetical protein
MVNWVWPELENTCSTRPCRDEEMTSYILWENICKTHIVKGLVSRIPKKAFSSWKEKRNTPNTPIRKL